MVKKILVVGGAGFIGSMVNKMLHTAGYETVVLDNLSYGKRKRVTQGIFVKGDLANRRLLEKIFSQNRFDAVMHFAALIDVGESVTNPSLYYKNNVVATLNLLEVMNKYGVKTFIFSSSAAVYGIPQTQLIKEDHVKNPINPYGQTKLMVENILADYDKAYGLKSISLRYFNATGGDPDGKIKNFNQKKSNLIPIVLAAIKNKTAVTINGSDYPTVDGTCVRDYIHIYDLGTAHIAAMEKLHNGGNSTYYNLGNGNGYSVKEVIKAAEKVTKKTVTTIEGPRRAGDPVFLIADAQKARQELGWVIKYPSLESMIEHAWQAF